ncbi:MAG: hypothetical protein M3Q80_01185 [bacterium]|nr:hypothetical protein [bacterium]
MFLTQNVSILLALIILLQLIIFWRHLRMENPSIRKGDIVLYHSSGSESGRNMITSVLDISSRCGTAIIRVEGSTMVVSQKDLQVLKVDRCFPIMIPGKPVVDGYIHELGKPSKSYKFFEGDPIPEGSRFTGWNEAKFLKFPLSWFNYSPGFARGKLKFVS